jgi:hypothetical protein
MIAFLRIANRNAVIHRSHSSGLYGSRLALPHTIWLSRISTVPGFCCDLLLVRARIFVFNDRMGRSAVKA